MGSAATTENATDLSGSTITTVATAVNKFKSKRKFKHARVTIESPIPPKEDRKKDHQANEKDNDGKTSLGTSVKGNVLPQRQSMMIGDKSAIPSKETDEYGNTKSKGDEGNKSDSPNSVERGKTSPQGEVHSFADEKEGKENKETYFLLYNIQYKSYKRKTKDAGETVWIRNASASLTRNTKV